MKYFKVGIPEPVLEKMRLILERQGHKVMKNSYALILDLFLELNTLGIYSKEIILVIEEKENDNPSWR